MFLYEEYEHVVGDVGQAPKENIRLVNGVQYVEPQTAGLILTYLANLYIDINQPQSAGEGTVLFIATSPPEGEIANALSILQGGAPGTIVMVKVGDARPNIVDVLVSDRTDGAVQDSDYAVLDVTKAVTEFEKKQETMPLVIGAAVGGGLGFVAGSIPGAVAGVVGGYLVANWLT